MKSIRCFFGWHTPGEHCARCGKLDPWWHYQTVEEIMSPPKTAERKIVVPSYNFEPAPNYNFEPLRPPAPAPRDEVDPLVEAAVDVGLGLAVDALLNSGGDDSESHVASDPPDDYSGDGGDFGGGGASGDW